MQSHVSKPVHFVNAHPQRECGEAPAIVGDRVELQLLTTLRCNLKCTYCSLEEGGVVGSQEHVTYTLDQLDAFIDKQLADKEIYVTFYGGEPTLNKNYIVDMMRRHPQFRYQLQTNGTLLDDLPDGILNHLSNILISVDGGERITDHYRGRGIYRQVIRNMQAIRPRVPGTLTARMTWSDAEINFDEIDGLAGSFDYVYFQFVAGEAYTPEGVDKRKVVLSQLVERFFARDDTLYPIIPIMGAVRNKVLPSRVQELYKGQTQCRVSTHIINVMPDGRIFPCPDLLYLPEMQQGDVIANWLRRSPLQPHPEMPCEGCEAFQFCRRNCMKNLYLAYVQKDTHYRQKVVEPICELVKHLGREIDRHNPKAWYACAALPVKKALRDCEVYEYVEIMP